ncbi:MAG: glycosyltransferase family 2 protein, partial [Candidatus Marinimicrobia bacterium]|nr:glycosyltransferase family 2 protein [Candidatus Neomarinimicrobiota bacterium]
MESQKPLISIIVLNYNGKRFLKTLFDSLLRTTYPNYELIMVDNHSSEDDIDFVKKNYPSVKVYDTGKNLGYAGGNNFGIKKANGEFVLLLNNDIEVTSGWLEPIMEEFESDENIAVCQPKILQMKNRNYFEYAGASGGFMDIFGYPFLRGRIMEKIEKDEGQYDDNIDLFWASGAAIAIRKKVLDQSGLLDEDFFLHMEEI